MLSCLFIRHGVGCYLMMCRFPSLSMDDIPCCTYLKCVYNSSSNKMNTLQFYPSIIFLSMYFLYKNKSPWGPLTYLIGLGCNNGLVHLNSSDVRQVGGFRVRCKDIYRYEFYCFCVQGSPRTFAHISTSPVLSTCRSCSLTDPS